MAALFKLNSGRKPSFKKHLRTLCSGLKSRTIFPTRVVFQAVFLEYFWGFFVCLFFAEEPRMVLVGGGDMVAGDPESRGTHTHFPDNNYFVHLHLSLNSERI